MMAEQNGLSFWNKYFLPVLVGGTAGVLSGLITVTIAIMSFKNTVLNAIEINNIKLEERTKRIEKLEAAIENKADKGEFILLSNIVTLNSSAIIGITKDIGFLRDNSTEALRKLNVIQDKVK